MICFGDPRPFDAYNLRVVMRQLARIEHRQRRRDREVWIDLGGEG